MSRILGGKMRPIGSSQHAVYSSFKAPKGKFLGKEVGKIGFSTTILIMLDRNATTQIKWTHSLSKRYSE